MDELADGCDCMLKLITKLLASASGSSPGSTGSASADGSAAVPPRPASTSDATRGSRRKRGREDAADGDIAEDVSTAPSLSAVAAGATAPLKEGADDAPKAKKPKRAKEPKKPKAAVEAKRAKEVQLPTGASMDAKRLAAYGINADDLGPVRRNKPKQSSKRMRV